MRVTFEPACCIKPIFLPFMHWLLRGEMGMGKTELREYIVTECFKVFKMVPIMGTAGERCGLSETERQ